MATDPILDIELLSAPISEEQPAGPYWRDDDDCRNNLFPAVDSAMREARINERKRKEVALFPEGSLERQKYKDPDWSAVVDFGQKLLQRSKDLWVAAWLAEAVARQSGFPGLRDGLRLINQLCDKYWDQIHPRPDEQDGIRLTLAQLDGETWADLVLLMPITRQGYSTADYDLATEMEGLDSDRDRETYRAAGVISTADFESRMIEAGPEFLVNLIEDIRAASEEFERLTSFLDEHCGQDAPASTRTRENLEQCLALVRELAAAHLPPELMQNDEEPQGPAEEVTSQPTDGPGNVSGVWNREQAFQEIARQAAQFEKYEPNSPVASILRQAIRLGKLSWREMIAGLTADQNVLLQILKQTGISELREGDSED
jgi:type VI secretion system protein ImpA